MRRLMIVLATIISFPTQAELFTMLIHEPQHSYEQRSVPKSTYWQDFNQFAGAMQQAGILRGGTAFYGGDSVRLVHVGRQTSVTRGPLYPKQLVLGGYLTIEVASVDEAIEWAKKAPPQYGLQIEVLTAQSNPTMSTKK